MQPMTLTEEQHEFRRRRAPVRRGQDRAAGRRGRRARRVLLADVRGAAGDGADRAVVSRRSTAAAAPTSSTQAIVAEELARVDASASLMFLISKLGMLPVINFGSRGAEDDVHARDRSRREPGQLLPVRGRRRQRRRVDDHAGRARRRRLHAHRHQGAGSRTAASPTCTRCSPGPTRSPDTGHHRVRGRGGLGRAGREARAQARASRARRRRRSRFDEVRVPDRQPHRREGQGFRVRHAHARPQPPDDRRAGGRHRPGRARLRRSAT